MKVTWTRRAIRDLTQARGFIARTNPAAANETALRIIDAVDTLSRQPRIGRSGRIDGTLEYVVADTTYILIYRLRKQGIDLLHIYDSRQSWPPS
jgi:plasmid stabilization system protein ParE